jgi:hypothetical protein
MPGVTRWPSVDLADDAVVWRTDQQGKNPCEVPTRKDVGRHVLVVSLGGLPLLQEHEFVLVVLALEQLEGFTAVRRSADVPAL